ncbi:hypothetical protein ACTFIZ_007558 [Dictyostelium cf. discoideum]
MSIESICKTLSQLCRVCHKFECQSINNENFECLKQCLSFLVCDQPHFHRKEYNSIEKEAKRERRRGKKKKEEEEEEEKRKKKEEKEKEEKENGIKKKIQQESKLKQKEEKARLKEELENQAKMARDAKKSKLDHLREMALGSFGQQPLTSNVLNLFKDLDEHINTLNMCSKEIVKSSNSVNQKYLNESTTTNTTIVTSNGITNTSHMPTHCKCIDSTIFSKTSSNVGSEVMNELKQNISHYDRVKSYSTGFLVNMVDVNTITYTIGYLSKLLSENNGKSCDICGDCLVFARIHNMLPYQESFDALTPMMA